MELVFDHYYFMKEALKEANKAFDLGEVPVGAIFVIQNQIISRAYNQTETLSDITAHAEILAITSASNFLNSKYLKDGRLYVTLEPCLMCAGALFWSQISTLVFGASDFKNGYRLKDNVLHPKTKIIQGIMSKESRELIQKFFKSKRK
tara:strand:+ start:29026 stop:29469 length:444 start_codon:yes stop_codon:yes gene_type:complete